MKNELIDVSETKKNLTIEIPSDEVDAQIEKVTRGYAKSARIPGFRPGKVPTRIVKQRFKEQILQDVARELVPRAVDEALQERGVEPVDSPNVNDFAIDEGQPLKFTATFETVPDFDPGDLDSITLRRPSAVVAPEAVDQMMERMRERAARFEPVEGRPVADGDTPVLDIERTDQGGTPDRHEGVAVTMGASANPPGFDAQLVGMSPGETKTFTVHFPEDYGVPEMANTDVSYTVTLKELRKRVVPVLDDEFAKDMGQFETLSALRERVTADMQLEAETGAQRQVRNELLRVLRERVAFEMPAVLVDREMERRVEEFVRRLMEQGVDPREANIDWAQFRDGQRESARDSVASALALDQIARRENIVAEQAAIDAEIEQLAARLQRTPAAVQAQLEKEGGIARLATGIRREKAVELALSRATIVKE